MSAVSSSDDLITMKKRNLFSVMCCYCSCCSYLTGLLLDRHSPIVCASASLYYASQQLPKSVATAEIVEYYIPEVLMKAVAPSKLREPHTRCVACRNDVRVRVVSRPAAALGVDIECKVARTQLRIKGSAARECCFAASGECGPDDSKYPSTAASACCKNNTCGEDGCRH